MQRGEGKGPLFCCVNNSTLFTIAMVVSSELCKDSLRFLFLLFRLLWNINHAHLNLSPLPDNVFCLLRPCHVHFVLFAFWLITNLSITFSLVWTVKMSCFLLASFFICSRASCRRDTFVFLSFLSETATQQSVFYCYICIALFYS